MVPSSEGRAGREREVVCDPCQEHVITRGELHVLAIGVHARLAWCLALVEQRTHLSGHVVHESRHRDAIRGHSERRVGQCGERAVRVLATIREERCVAHTQWGGRVLNGELHAGHGWCGMSDGQLSSLSGRSETKERNTSAITPLTNNKVA
jgi:hypothetical protein